MPAHSRATAAVLGVMHHETHGCNARVAPAAPRLGDARRRRRVGTELKAWAAGKKRVAKLVTVN
jgi:hypothetical protein